MHGYSVSLDLISLYTGPKLMASVCLLCCAGQINCFKTCQCYALAFGVPAILLILSLGELLAPLISSSMSGCLCMLLCVAWSSDLHCWDKVLRHQETQEGGCLTLPQNSFLYCCKSPVVELLYTMRLVFVNFSLSLSLSPLSLPSRLQTTIGSNWERLKKRGIFCSMPAPVSV